MATLHIDLFDEDGEVDRVAVPAQYEVCSRCCGEGVHDHPAFANGMSANDFGDDPDFREEYLAGRYDVTCSACHGKRVQLEICWGALESRDSELADRIREHYDDLAAYEAESAAERRAGA